MSKQLRIAVLIPAATADFNDRILQALKPVIPADVKVDVFNISQGHPSIENRTDWLENGMPTVLLARSLAAQGYQGIWLSDFDMCGVEAAREVIDIPIIGGFPACAFSALALSQCFSIITVLQSTLAMQREHVLTYGLSESFASIYAIDCPVAELSNTEVVVACTLQLAIKAVKEDGAQAILLGCTGFVDVAERVAALLEESVGAYVPVIDPNQAGFSFLVSLVRMGLRPSRLTYSKVNAF